jgi:hypothetical protein
MRIFSAAALLLMIGCAPSDIARSSCESIGLSTADEWSCTVTGDIVGQTNMIEYDTESRNSIAQVDVALQVKSGTLRMRYADMTGSKELVVTPSQPATLAMRTQLHRERRSFTLTFEPVEGTVEGLTGTVKYSTPLTVQ